MTTLLEDFAELRARIALAESDRDAWRASGSQERYLEGCSLVAALDLRLERLRDEGLRRSAEREPPAAVSLPEGFFITYDGHQYDYDGYRYDRLDDAVAYAKLQRSRPGHRSAPPAAGPRTPEAPDAAQLETMASLAITFRDGRYHFGPFGYDRLAHAVSYARLQLASPSPT